MAPLEALDIDDNMLLGACPDGPVAPDVGFDVSVQREVKQPGPIPEDEVAAPDGKVLGYPGRAQLWHIRNIEKKHAIKGYYIHISYITFHIILKIRFLRALQIATGEAAFQTLSCYKISVVSAPGATYPHYSWS